MCKGEPLVQFGEALEQNCVTYDMSKLVDNTTQWEWPIYVPTDGEMTGQEQASGLYYITVFATKSIIGTLNVLFEYVSVNMIETNANNPIRIQPDAASTRFGGSNYTFQIYDVLLENDNLTSTHLFTQFDANASNISICRVPISYSTMRNRRSIYCSMNNGSL